MPVLNRLSSKPSERRLPESPSAEASPARPPAVLTSPVCMSAWRNVPVVTTTALGPIGRPPSAADSRDPTIFDGEPLDHLLAEGQPFLPLDGELGEGLIRLLVGLGSRAMHGGAFAPVEQAELDGGRVGDHAHRAAEGVDLADDLPFRHAADGRVAAHLADGVDVDREQRRAEAHPARRQGRFQPGMPGANDDDIKSVGVVTRDQHGIALAGVVGLACLRRSTVRMLHPRS